jgi:hypothetical protein
MCSFGARALLERRGRQTAFPSVVRLVAAAGIVGLFSPAAWAGTVTWPSGAPNCGGTLQTCITSGTNPGDTLEIATNGPVAESPDVTKSLTILPASGFSPVIDGFFLLEGQSSATSFKVSSLTVNGSVRAFPGTGDLDVEISDNTVAEPSSFGVGIEVSSGTSPPYGNVTARILRNTVSVTGDGDSAQCIGIILGPIFDSGTSSGRIEGNRVTATACGEGNGIIALNGQGETLTVDILDNFVTATGTGDGIEIRNFQQTAGSLLIGRVVNNVVTGQKSVAGFPGGIVVSADGFEPVEAQVVNNTVAYNDAGIGVSGRTDLGATITGIVANNIVFHNTHNGLFIDSGVAATVSNDHNLVFGNGSDDFTPGLGTLATDPLLVSTTDFHLQGASPAIDAGNTAEVPPDIKTDLDGHSRVTGAAVDIGAYEAGAVGVPALSGVALAALSLLLSIAGWAALRRPG